MPRELSARIMTAIDTIAPRRASSLGGECANNVTIDCPLEKALGLRVTEDTLTVRQVHAGGWIAAWNDAHPSQAVREGDSIVSVNSLQGDVAKMLATLKMKPSNRAKPLSVVFRIENSADANLLGLDLSFINLNV